MNSDWTTENPTKPGWYWIELTEDDDGQIVHVIDDELFGIYVTFTGTDQNFYFSRPAWMSRELWDADDEQRFVGSKWAGPLESPV